MQLSIEEAKKLVEQQQIAHKLLAGLYQNILRVFSELSEYCGYEFKSWDPFHYGRPCQSQSNPATRWIWDFLPFYSIGLNYVKNQTKNSTHLGDGVMHIQLHFDEGYTGGNMDPLSIQSSEGYVKIMLFRAIAVIRNKDVYVHYDQDAEWPEESSEGTWSSVSGQMEVYYKKYSLSEFLANSESIKIEIKHTLDERS